MTTRHNLILLQKKIKEKWLFEAFYPGTNIIRQAVSTVTGITNQRRAYLSNRCINNFNISIQVVHKIKLYLIHDNYNSCSISLSIIRSITVNLEDVQVRNS